MAARAGVEPTTLRLKVIDSTNAPPRRHADYHTSLYGNGSERNLLPYVILVIRTVKGIMIKKDFDNLIRYDFDNWKNKNSPLIKQALRQP